MTGLEELMHREASRVPGWKLGPMEAGLFEAEVRSFLMRHCMKRSDRCDLELLVFFYQIPS